MNSWTLHHADCRDILPTIPNASIHAAILDPPYPYIKRDYGTWTEDEWFALMQAEVLLDAFHGWGTWHYQVALDDIDGMHYILTFNRAYDLGQATAKARKCLKELDRRHPDLGKQAIAAGMPTFANMEIKPSVTVGCRLPLCRGYQMLLDRPLADQDVVAYMEWLNDPKRKYMPKEEILDLLWYKLAPSHKAVPQKQQKCSIPDGKFTIGSLRHCCRQKTTGFWRGTFNPQGSLNSFMIVTARIFNFEGVPQEQAVDLLKQFVREIPGSAWECSSRLVAQDFRKIDKDIVQKAKKAYDGNRGQSDIALSDSKLEKAVACWQSAGFRLSDKSTWDNCWNSFAAVPDVEWTEQDVHDIDVYLGPLLGKRQWHLAVKVANGMAKVAAVKHASENGIDYTYWQRFLSDEFGINCGNRNKMAAILKAARELGILAIHSKAIWNR
jgi:hypothetical protein